MSPGRRLILAGLIGAVPCAVLLILLLAGQVAPAAGLLGLAVTAAAALALAWRWSRVVSRLLAGLQGAGSEPTRPATPWLTGDPFGERALTAAFDRARQQHLAGEAELRGLRLGDPALVERLPDPLILLDGDGRVHRANAAARTAFGNDMAAVLRHPTLRAAIDRTLAGAGPQNADVMLAVPITREAQATVIGLDPPLRDGSRMLLLLSDRTRERAVERMRADFVTNASHELRTPLASLIGFIETLRGPAADDPPAQARFLGIMAEQAARMNRLIDDLLSLSRIEVSEHRPPTERVEPTALIRRLLAGFEPRLAERRMRLELDAAPALPPVIGDADQLAQVLQNLLENALKYGREGGFVRVAAVAATGGGWPSRPGVVLSVADDGPGIAREHLPRLTERFYRVDKGRSRAIGGTGLGLAIVRHIVIRHRGELRIDSVEAGQDRPSGSTFAIWLPAAEAA